MAGIVTGAAGVLVALSVTVYLSVIGILCWKLALEEPPVRRAMVPPLMPVFCQNCGIPFGVLAFALHSPDLGIVALLLIALAWVTRTEDAASLHPSIEVPLLSSALISLGALFAANLLA